MTEGMGDGSGKVLTLDDLIEALDRRERAPSNVPKVDTFNFNGERVSDWLDLVEQARVGLSDEVKLQRILRYVVHEHHKEVGKVVDAANGSWARFRDGMQRKYRLGDDLLTTTDLETMNKDDFTTIGAFVQEFKKKARKVHRISEEAQCAIFLGLLTASEASELTSHGGGSAKLTWVTIDKGVEDESLDQVEQHQMRLQRRKKKEKGRHRIWDPRSEEDCHGRAGGVRPPTSHGRVPQAARTRSQNKAETSQLPSQAPGQAPPRREPEPERRKEVVEVPEEEEEDDDEEDERLRQEEDQRAKLRARKRDVQEKAEPSQPDGVPKRKKYTVQLEEGFDVERMVDTGVEMNIIWEREAIMLGMEVDCSDHGMLHGANCKAVFCGTASNVIVEIGKVRARTCFFIMPNVDHSILLGRSFLCRTETLIFNKHDGTMILLLCDPACGNYEVITSRNTGPGRGRNRPNLGSFTFEKSENERRRHWELPEEEGGAEVLTLSLTDVNKVMEVVATRDMADPETMRALREQVLESPQVLMVGLMKESHRAYAFNDDQRGRLDVDKIPMIRIHTVPQERWNLRGVRYPNPNEEKIVVDYLDDKMCMYVADYSSGSYASSWSCFVKPIGTRLNVVTVRDVLSLLEEYSLTASDPKSKHYMREATILGFVYNESGRRPDVKKTDKIVEWSVPFRSITDVRSFLDTCGFWRSFVKNFAAKTEHLRKLVRQDQEWVWGGDQEEAVKRMKEEFKEGGLVLGASNYEVTEEKPFIIETGAGPTALRGVLVEADAERKERPLRFESRTLNTTERNYFRFKKETLAVLHCLRIFGFGRMFILRVDPTALACSLKNCTPSDPTVARWLTYIWMFNFELERIPGDKNRADGLSRINRDGPDQESIEDTPPVVGFLDQKEDVCLHINEWSLRVPSCVSHPTWLAPRGYEQKAELVLKPFREEDPWGSRDVHWMMKLALADTHSLVEEVRTTEEGPTQVEEHGQLMGGMYLLTNTLLSDFSKTVMQRGGRDARPRQRPLGAPRGDDQRRPFGRESTPAFEDDNIGLFLDAYQAHATREGWTTMEMIRNMRGVGRFEDTVAHIGEEALTRPDVEARMKRLRVSSVGRDGLPIRLEEGNAEEFISAYEQYMCDQGTVQEEWMQTLLLWTRRAERLLAGQIRDRACDCEDCRTQLR
ncbi:hypothetical protein CBR_g54879 [Chara braunii]|uniref:RNA-directed DNA polymerase n=1 Tax=Chara braunii TaxID=69332 RepID=A0A388JPN1_CHABU|nr:hypothetical protein CBR_g54879 [Chara braunii]|eukprot:GBG59776.1 hypothetical protein CBR_g54879 [Chara braunii]